MFSLLGAYRTPIIIAALIAVLATEFVYVRGVYVKEGEAKVQAVQLEYQQRDADMASQLHAKETELANLNQQLEKQNANAKRKVEEANRRYTDLVNSRGLWDPGTTPMPHASSGGNSGASSNAEGPQCNREFSKEASGFLLSITREADELKEDYATCMEWASKARAILKSKRSNSSSGQQ